MLRSPCASFLIALLSFLLLFQLLQFAVVYNLDFWGPSESHFVFKGRCLKIVWLSFSTRNCLQTPNHRFKQLLVGTHHRLDGCFLVVCEPIASHDRLPVFIPKLVKRQPNTWVNSNRVTSCASSLRVRAILLSSKIYLPRHKRLLPAFGMCNFL